MNTTLIDSTESLKRYAKVSSKIVFKLSLVTAVEAPTIIITVPTLKGDFLRLLADIPPSPVSAEFDGEILTVFGGILSPGLKMSISNEPSGTLRTHPIGTKEAPPEGY